jgi:hypothetical protein
MVGASAGIGAAPPAWRTTLAEYRGICLPMLAPRTRLDDVVRGLPRDA